MPKIDAEWRGNLRLPKKIYEAVAEHAAKRPGRISVNTWILEAIVERLSQEDTVESPKSKE